MKRAFSIRDSGFREAARWFGCIAIVGMAFALNSASAQPITTDSRIKTLVYNANEVFAITTHYGYQSNIEFGPKESIETISVGDRIAWQIIPAGRRLFIRAMEENARTNMTVVTNQHAYQFDLRSSSADAVFGSEELTYVVRFFYPPASGDVTSVMPTYTPPLAAPPVAVSSLAAPAPVIIPNSPAPPAPIAKADMPPVASFAPARAPVSPGYNFRYTYSGPNDIAPTKIFDDGKTTYFKLPTSQAPKVSVVTPRGDIVEMNARRTPDGLLAVDTIASRFNLNQVGRQVVVYNEAGGEVQ